MPRATMHHAARLLPGATLVLLTALWPTSVSAQQGDVTSAAAVDSATTHRAARNALRQYLHQVYRMGYVPEWPPTRTLSDALEYLEEALDALPADDWILSHVVGMNLTIGNSERALEAAMRCVGTRWRCMELRGMVLHTLGRDQEAEASFVEALAEMPVVMRCQRTDLRWFLDESDRRPYAGLDCLAAGVVGRRVWWLADPLQIRPGNERYAAHHARWVQIQLFMRELAMVGGYGYEVGNDLMLGVGRNLSSPVRRLAVGN
jgi:hypothetical protein